MDIWGFAKNDQDKRQQFLFDALNHSSRIKGLTHDFYLYPARFSPVFARAAIGLFTERDDWIIDPFMGGGTSIVEGIVNARHMIGVDINPLARFVASARTTPLSERDADSIHRWVHSIMKECHLSSRIAPPDIRNLPPPIGAFILLALMKMKDTLQFPRQQNFARCSLLRLGHWALDCREHDLPEKEYLASKLELYVDKMLNGLGEFVDEARSAGVAKNKITGMRKLIHSPTQDISDNMIPDPARGRIKMVITSPPYPMVHILYNRWQVNGRRETAAPYWIAGIDDYRGESYYTFGSRSATGLQRYFMNLCECYSALRPFLADDAIILQLVSFRKPDEYLPRFLSAMRQARYKEIEIPNGGYRPRRVIPNRKWYARTGAIDNSAMEVLIAHQKDA